MRRSLAALMITLATGPALAEMTASDREALRGEVRAYLLEHPEVLMEAMEVLKSREEEQAAAAEKAALVAHADAFFNAPHDWVGGNPQGDITVVEFLDYRCGYCRKAWQEVEELVKSDGNIRFVMKEFPILGEDSLLSARFAVAVRLLHGDEAYKAAHDALITLKGQPDAPTLTQLAGDLGLEAGPILDRMAAADVTDIIAANHGTADLLQISGTPTFIIGDQVIRGYLPLESLRAIVAEARKGG